GVRLNGFLQNQIIRSNVAGVTGSGVLGPDGSFEFANLLERNVAAVGSFFGTIRFNNIFENGLGIDATANQIIHNNVLARQTVQSILVNGVNRVFIVNNTVYNDSLTDPGISLVNGASEVELRNNILVTKVGGTGVFIDATSLSGFFSDYNNHAAEPGAALFDIAGTQFFDLLSWQNVDGFDQNSIGTTPANLFGNNPTFLGEARWDFEVAQPGAGRRFDSPTVDAADPRVDIGGFAARPNLLTNPGFESGLAGWTTGGNAAATNFAFSGAFALNGGAGVTAFAEQTVDLVAAGINTALIDARNLVAVFGARFRSAMEAAPDSAMLTLTFLGAGGNTLGTETVMVDPTTDRWSLEGGRAFLPFGTRSINFRIDLDQNTGPSLDAFADGAFLYVQSESVGTDQGAFGNTIDDLTRIEGARLRLRQPNMPVAIVVNQSFTLEWDSYNNIENRQVRIDIYQDGVEGPELLGTLAAAVA
ncbi:MAG: right-handed parallel beta-helix repeat-containing protein, partial [Planctomycetota bacterium]|nr:right-handed parallel beta-helix repeat-containing protein [Planctomycetota bacterium]